MIEQLAMWNVYASHIMNTPHMLAIFIGSLLLALLFYLLFRKTAPIHRKVTYLYLHILFIFLPFIFSALMWKCLMPVVACSPKMVIYLASLGAGGTLLLSFITLPYIYNWASNSKEIKEGEIKDFVRDQSHAIGIREPKVYAVEDIKPCAYSITNIRPSIFVSVGLCELLGRKEMEAVLFHELYHIKQKTSFWRFSINTLRIFSPLSSFITTDDAMNKEEREADNFAVLQQGTKKYLRLAKSKINVMSKKLRK